MRFIKRLLFIVILLFAAFFLYRLINPTAAKALLYDIKSFSNEKLGTKFALTVLVDDVLIDTGVVLDETGILVGDENILQEFTDEDSLLFDNDNEIIRESFDDIPSKEPSDSPSPPSSTPPSSSTSPKNGLSSQDERDFKNLFGN